MKLKIGITGIDSQTHVEENLINEFAKNINSTFVYTVFKLDNSKIDSNYYRLKIINGITNQKFDILINSHYEYYCGINEESTWMKIEFIELPENLISSVVDFEYLNPIQLSLEIQNQDLSQLTKFELKQIKYWNSKTFGEIIFNGYD
nr:hypothetical protein [uncultured Flavobacterium sp.]